MPIVRHEIGHERLSGGIPDLEEEAAETEYEQAGRGAGAGSEETEHDRGLANPADEDQWPPAEVIGEVAAQVARPDPDQRADEVGEAEHGLIRTELLDRPDPDEAPDGRARERAGEVDAEDRPESRIGLRAEDDAVERC